MIVTVSRAYGAGSHAVAERAAQQLGYRLVDDELEAVVATRLGAPADVVRSVGDWPPTFGERVLAELDGGVPESAQPPSREDDLREARQEALELAIRVVAARGNAVILGRASGAVLAGRTDLVRVFVTAPLAWRIEHLMAAQSLDEVAARTEIARVDEARRDYAREFYRLAWGDPKHYDLIVNTARLGIAGAGDTIACAVRAAGA